LASILDPNPSKAVKHSNISISCALAQNRQNMLLVQILRPSKKTYTDVFLHSADMLHVSGHQTCSSTAWHKLHVVVPPSQLEPIIF